MMIRVGMRRVNTFHSHLLLVGESEFEFHNLARFSNFIYLNLKFFICSLTRLKFPQVTMNAALNGRTSI